MDEKALFTKFWTNEAKTTRKVLQRIPDGSDYRPDQKSRTAKDIGWQIVCEEKIIIEALETGKMGWAPVPAPATMKEVVDAYDAQKVPARLEVLPQSKWDAKTELFGRQREVSELAWSFLFDIVHHRI